MNRRKFLQRLGILGAAVVLPLQKARKSTLKFSRRVPVNGNTDGIIKIEIDGEERYVYCYGSTGKLGNSPISEEESWGESEYFEEQEI